MDWYVRAFIKSALAWLSLDGCLTTRTIEYATARKGLNVVNPDDR